MLGSLCCRVYMKCLDAMKWCEEERRSDDVECGILHSQEGVFFEFFFFKRLHKRHLRQYHNTV